MASKTMQSTISVILLCEEEDYVLQAMEGILSQRDIEGGIQVILANTCIIHSEDKIRALCSQTPGVTVEIMDLEGYSTAAAKNKALERVNSGFITFMDSKDSFSEGALWKACEFLDSHSQEIDFVSCAILYSDGNHLLNQARYNENRIVDLMEEPFHFQYDLIGTIWKTACFREYQFQEELPYHEDNHFVMEYLASKSKYGVLKDVYYHRSDVLIDRFTTLPWVNDSAWYLDSCNNYFLPLLEDITKRYHRVPTYIQLALFYDFQFRLAANLEEANKQALEGEQITQFFTFTKKLLSNLEDEIILNQSRSKFIVLEPVFLINLLKIKYGYNSFTTEQDLQIVPQSLQQAYKENIKTLIADINLFEFDNSFITIHFELNCAVDQDRYEVHLGGEASNIPVLKTKLYATTKIFGLPMYQRHTYQLTIPVENLKNRSSIQLYVNYNNEKFPLKIWFGKSHTKLTTVGKNLYWYKSGYLFQATTSAITVRRVTRMEYFIQELKVLEELLLHQGMRGKSAFLLRMFYWITRPYFKHKSIWLSFDKIYKGGDNGEYFFRYASAQKDKITNYYLIEKNTKDYNRLKKQRLNLLSPKTIKLYLILMNTDIVFATHAKVLSHMGFPGIAENYFRGIFSYEMVCIQHGLTVQQLAHTANKVFDNTKYYYCASKYEIENLMQPEYGYDRSELKLTGLPRYDGLINDDKKQILITPTWRMSIASKPRSGKIRPYNPNFKNTTYFKAYNELINHKRLIAKAKEKGYKLIYLIHPTFTSQKDDFHKNDTTEILTADMGISYEELLTQSSLMVTDYSGVQFDFAYMRKPIVYSHYKDIPPFYEEGSFNYDTMAFGDICTDMEELVDIICEYLDRDCQMKEQYKKRADDFFAYADTDNCKRIYQESLKHQTQINRSKK